MDSLVQLCALGLVFLSFGNIYRILSRGSRINVLLPSRQVTQQRKETVRPSMAPRIINVDAVEVTRSPRRELPAPEDWTFDDLYRSKKS